METLNERAQRQAIPRYISIIARRLNIKFQPNHRSSLYKRTPVKKVIKGQEEWQSPVGTLRLSDHWNYVPLEREKIVYSTDKPIADYAWALCVNTGEKLNPWRVLAVFNKKIKNNVIYNIDFEKIKFEINNAILHYQG